MLYHKQRAFKYTLGPPGSMPNPEVKPVSADGTVWGTYGRVGRRRKTVERRETSLLVNPTGSSRLCIESDILRQNTPTDITVSA